MNQWLAMAITVFCSFAAQAEDAFSAHDAVKEAGVGIYAPDYHESYSDAGDDDHDSYQAPPIKSEDIYVNGKRVCFKLESEVSIAYYCE